MLFVAKDMQPFQTVNDHGFHKLIKDLEPRYEYQDHKNIITISMPELYAREKEGIGQAVANLNSLAMSMDV